MCLEDFNEENVFPLGSCDHIFHDECLEIYLKGEIAESKFPLKCPEIKCGKEMQLEDLKILLN